MLKNMFLYAVFLVILLTGCNINKSDTESIQNMNNQNNESYEYMQDVVTSSYSISIPQDWSYDILESGTVNFLYEENIIGGIYTQPYYSDLLDPINGLLPNHSEIISRKELDGFLYETHLINLEVSPPAVQKDASNKMWIYIFIVVDQSNVYEIYVNTKYIEENSIITIAKSFNLL